MGRSSGGGGGGGVGVSATVEQNRTQKVSGSKGQGPQVDVRLVLERAAAESCRITDSI